MQHPPPIDATRMPGGMRGTNGRKGGTPVQAWTKPEGLSACGMSTTNCTTEPGGNCSHYPSTLFNHMIMPFVGFGLRSVLWYQGEADSDEGFPMQRQQYACVFGRMIQGWRDSWGAPAMPFGFVQLSSWTGNWGFDHLPCVANYCPVISRIRLAQGDVVGQAGPPIAPLHGTPAFPLKNTFMAVAYDQGDNQAHGVHSRFKSKPAHRLALQVLHTAFAGFTPPGAGDYSGPLPVSASSDHRGKEGGAAAAAATRVTSVTVQLSHAAAGVRLNDTRTCNEQFGKLCCGAGNTAFGARICTAAKHEDCEKDANGQTVFNANVTVGSGVTIVLSAMGVVGTPTFVDFGQTDFPQCSVVGTGTGIALGPFSIPVVA